MNDTTNNNSGNMQLKMKKIKRPIKRPAAPNSTNHISVPPREKEAPFTRSNVSNSPANSVEPASLNNSNSNPFDIDSFLKENSLPAMHPKAIDAKNDTIEQSFIRDEDVNLAPISLKEKLMVGKYFTNMAIIATACICFVIGIIFAQMAFDAPTAVQSGLQGIVVNTEVPRGRARCGIAERTQGCILYIMNPQRQNLDGRDFYDLASQLTGRQRFMIETGNMRYSKMKIKPGEIAQINIPPLQ